MKCWVNLKIVEFVNLINLVVEEELLSFFNKLGELKKLGNRNLEKYNKVLEALSEEFDPAKNDNAKLTDYDLWYNTKKVVWTAKICKHDWSAFLRTRYNYLIRNNYKVSGLCRSCAIGGDGPNPRLTDQ